MLVDDNDTDNFISKRIIEITEFSKNVIVKNSGKSALDYLLENQDDPGNIPDIIFLDINMPIVDGFVFLYEYEKFGNNVKDKCREPCACISTLSIIDRKESKNGCQESL